MRVVYDESWSEGGVVRRDRGNSRAHHWGSLMKLRWILATMIGLGTLAAAVAGAAPPAPADSFVTAISRHCGKAYAGRITANEPAAPNDPFADKPLVMHVLACSPQQLRIPFHVGDDHSRTWVVTRTASGLQLKHDHRHADGSPDVLTMYGGDTTTAGTASRQEFPVDAESRALFEREGSKASVTNTWAMEIEPGKRFAYELARPGRLFRVEFDLTQPVATPPLPWGGTDTRDYPL
jgi:hypothetical protein